MKQQYDRPPVCKHKAALGSVEEPTGRQVDLGCKEEDRQGERKHPEIDHECLHARCRRPRTKARSAAPARAVSSSRIEKDQDSIWPKNDRVMPAACIVS